MRLTTVGSVDGTVTALSCRQTCCTFAEALPLLCSTEIVAGSVDGTVRRFDIRSGMLYSDNLGQAVTQVALSHDGNCVLASCLEVGLRLLDMGSGELLARYAGETRLWHCWRFCPVGDLARIGLAVSL